ncbi:carboxyltransferase domain-containing protein [Nesterenkonia cremea]|uniref:Allophanate hydrolase n=1 Tax=Nesterenkonia cremea TaxID=1882340 RepID=A0A917AS52_9MICC|nr:carboxyltransferase domain-containing protein [Nesterenkonia cremea]GGE71726.1 allophanate hydrolase [Nesterenkonia cremea]
MSAAPEQTGTLIRGLREAGPRSLLLEFATLDDVLACHQQLTGTPLEGQVDAVAAARTILLRFTSRTAVRAARESLAVLEIGEFSAGDARQVELEVVYDGEDLPELAETLGMSVEALISWHTGQSWTGAFGGFAPGFTYCVPQGEQAQALAVPRRSTPRTAVPESSVALAGEFSAVYPRVSPGGWQLIGRSPQVMWDLSRAEQDAQSAAAGEQPASPALVSPGDTVRYRAVSPEAIQVREPAGESSAAAAQADEQPGDLTVLSPGLQSLLQDFGRSGLSDLGVSRAGIADEAAALQANRLVGNTAESPVLEVLHAGLQLRAERDLVLAASGAEPELAISPDAESSGSEGSIPDSSASARTAPLRAPFLLAAGETLSVGAPHRGMRTVLAVRGGFLAEPVLGSVSADTMSGLGPAPLQTGQSLRVGREPRRPVGAPEPAAEIPDAGPVTLRFTYGPREDWFSATEARRLTEQDWLVTQDSDRIGIRLDVDPSDPQARALERSAGGELPSEGVVRGSLQMPPAGKPVLFLNDHPVTGGYPVIGVVIDQDLPRAAQLAPGQSIRLTAVDPDTLQPLT